MGLKPQVFKDTGRATGWREYFSPETGASGYLGYARLVLDAKTNSHKLVTGQKEWMLFCIKPSATVVLDGVSYELRIHDMLYLPRHVTAKIAAQGGCDIALASSPSHFDSIPQLIRYEDIKDDPNYYFDVGSDELGTRRRIHNMLGHNVRASRLLAGFTIGQPGAWTSWPPHEHAESKEEYYLFFDMPAPAFSVQFVFSSVAEGGFSTIVQEGDCVTIPHGYHPTAAAPGYSSCFLWVMAAHDPEKDRDFKHGINIHPDYQAVKFL